MAYLPSGIKGVHHHTLLIVLSMCPDLLAVKRHHYQCNLKTKEIIGPHSSRGLESMNVMEESMASDKQTLW